MTQAAARPWAWDAPEGQDRPVSPLDGQPLDVVGVVEIADRLKVRQQTVAQWRYRHVLPAAQWTVSGHPAWDWQRIAAWARATGRDAALDTAGGTA